MLLGEPLGPGVIDLKHLSSAKATFWFNFTKKQKLQKVIKRNKKPAK